MGIAKNILSSTSKLEKVVLQFILTFTFQLSLHFLGFEKYQSVKLNNSWTGLRADYGPVQL